MAHSVHVFDIEEATAHEILQAIEENDKIAHKKREGMIEDATRSVIDRTANGLEWAKYFARPDCRGPEMFFAAIRAEFNRLANKGQ